ncbi:MAG: UDP-3-O-(3-hydroxymyristoyl)glucosamine N-acyltransferase [Kiloniellales bacterium]
MADPRFFRVAGPFTLNRLASIAGAEIVAGANEDAVFRDVAPLDSAGPEEVSFLDNKRYVEAFKKSRAGACLLHAAHAAQAPPGMALMLCEDPYESYARVARAFYPEAALEPGLAAGATIDSTARIGEGSRVDEGAVIGARVEIGRRCHVGANAVIGDGVTIGEDTVIGPMASLSHCVIGSRVLLHPGVRIGQRGFGFARVESGPVKVPQLGRVIVHDDVEIGANSTVDRGTGPDTVIGPGCMIDNLVQIGHNVRLGRGCVVVAQAGISGSTRLEEFVVVAAQAGLTGHLKIGKGVQIAAQSGVMRDVAPGAQVCGAPAVPLRQFFRQVATLQRLAETKRPGNR